MTHKFQSTAWRGALPALGLLLSFSVAACSSSSKTSTLDGGLRDSGVPLDGAVPDVGVPVDAAVDSATPVDLSGPTSAQLSAAFDAAGYTVGIGHALRFGIDDCAALPNCFGANPSSPYILFSTPLAPGQTTLPGGIVAAVPNVPAGQTVGLQMAVDEAVVITGVAPPLAKYFSLDPYLFARNGVSVFSALSDPVNQLVMTQPVFDAPLTFVVASDNGIYQQVRSTLVTQGVDPARIYPVTIPQSVAHLPATASATTAGTDILLLLGRVALFDDANAGASYLANVPLNVFRLTPRQSGTAVSPLPSPAARVAGTGTNESAYASSFNALVTAVTGSFPGDTVSEITMQTPALHDVLESPANCIDNLLKCNGGDRDTTYNTGPINADLSRGYVLTDSELVAIVGVNHKATGKCTYANVIPGNGTRNGGVTSVDDPSFIGTATSYLPSDPNRDKLFVWFFGRSCGALTNCTEIPLTFPGVAETERFYLATRAYLEPSTAIEPNPEEIIAERVFRIVPPSPSPSPSPTH